MNKMQSRISKMKPWQICVVLLLLLAVKQPLAFGQPQSHYSRVFATGYYLREPRDRAWKFKIQGNLPSFAGIYVLIHDINSKVLWKGSCRRANIPPRNL